MFWQIDWRKSSHSAKVEAAAWKEQNCRRPFPAQSGRRSASGSLMMEVSIIASMVSVVAVFCANLGMVSLASSINDSACRDAARAAAQGGNSANALQLAQAAIKAHATDGYFISQPTINTNNLVY